MVYFEKKKATKTIKIGFDFVEKAGFLFHIQQ